MRAVLLVLVGCGGNASPPDAPVDPCACTYGMPAALGTIATPSSELSGITASRTHANLLWTHADSGDSARVFAIGTDGKLLGTATLAGATAIDWEDIATAPCGDHQCLYVADTGDNDLVRTSVRLYEIDEPAATGGAATFRAFDIMYPDGAHNAEALIVDPRDGESYVIAKQIAIPTPVYRMPRTAGSTATAEQIGTLAFGQLVTAADLYADDCGVRLLVRTLHTLVELRGPVGTTVADLLAAEQQPAPLAFEPQGEAIAYLPDGHGYVTTTEGANPPLAEVTCR